ncbi:MAG: DUF2905 domain-containing protein [Hyphomicrobium sp.]
MTSILLLAAVIMLTLGGLAYLAEKQRADRDAPPPVYSLLPGDIKYESPDGNFHFYFPITTSIVVSIVLSLAMWLFS